MKGKKLVYWILWGSLLSALVVYLVIGTVAELGPAPEDEGIDQTIVLVLGAASAISLLISLAVRFLLVPRLINQESPQAPVFYIVALALAESVGIHGLVLRFLGAPSGVLMAFVGIAIFALGIQAPIFPGKEAPSMRKMPE